MNTQKTITLHNGDLIPAIGLGTWKSKPEELYDAIINAVQMGYRHIDCAAIYANEHSIGKALKDLMTSGEIKRESLWITSKLWNNAHRAKDVAPALDQSLKDLKLDYLDLYLMHWPVAFKPEVRYPQTAEEYLSLDEVPLAETWGALLRQKETQKVRHVGVSNFSIPKLQNIIDATGAIPAMNQVELHPYLQQDALLEFCNNQHIILTAYSPLGSRDRIPEMKAENEPHLLQDPKVLELTEKLHASPAQVLIAWHLHRNCCVIPKSVNSGRQLENLESYQLTFTDEDLRLLKTIDRNFRFVNGKFFEVPGNSYENIYDEVR
ncbi:MAG: aldo/keto reductase [Flavobacteriaceae bacterium]|nr:aldo/keto reductase [Flavobacteriaceae bacterium]